MSMICLKCGGKTKVDSTVTLENSVIRSRKCILCGEKFFTEETINKSNRVRGLYYRTREQRRNK